VTTNFGPGVHDWAYWDATIQDVLAWLPLGTSPKGTA
jgi:S-formylglutathione hydrolase FrmB